MPRTRLTWLALLAVPAAIRAQTPDRARALHQDSLVFDAHVHVVNRDGHTIEQGFKRHRRRG